MAKGFNQQPSVDFVDTYSPVAKFASDIIILYFYLLLFKFLIHTYQDPYLSFQILMIGKILSLTSYLDYF